MESTTIDQILNLIEKSQNILLLTHAKADPDGLGSMLSAYLVLTELGKNVTAATNDPTPENLNFLPSMKQVQNSLVSSSEFVISLDISKTPLDKIKYNLEEGNKINIIVTPKGGRFSPSDVSFNQETGAFDLIITFDTGNLEHLGPIYDRNAELFFKTPLINIDHHASNTDYGQLNLVDVVAASATQVWFGVLLEIEKKYNKKLITPDIATLLLAGLITDTGSFQHANTSPRAMSVAAKLIDLGARQQEIIKNIYKTKKLSTLKLWGIVLSNVETDPLYRIVWSAVSKEDLEEAGAQSEETEGIIDDLLSNAPGAELIALLKYNEEGYVSVSMRSTTNAVDVGKLATDFGGGGHVRASGFKIRDGRSLNEVLKLFLEKAREYQGKRLNINQDLPAPAKKDKPIEATVEAIQESPKPEPKKSEPEKPSVETQDLAPPKGGETEKKPMKPNEPKKPKAPQDRGGQGDLKPKKEEPPTKTQ